ncbi:hypothetical protein DERF_014627 [Dermatophagoides farinae]|uniref:Uncharacterized protein n=1 Tax=Dermatophagoides farinae TaxID=6954 RepID=A0A922KUQ4_DERFA|nr:hypothetical protein DERF_014627 [Dermatophagoides farinae]
MVPYIGTAPTTNTDTIVESNQNVKNHRPSLISPARAIKMNRYRQSSSMKFQVPINSTRHRIKFGFDELNLTANDQQPQIEVPTNSRDRTPLSLVFRSSSSPLAIRHSQDHSFGSTSLHVENEQQKSSSSSSQSTTNEQQQQQFTGYQLIEPLSMVEKPKPIQEIVPVLIIPEVFPIAITQHPNYYHHHHQQQQPKLINDNNVINQQQQQPNSETLKAIEHMIVAQDLSSYLYEPLLLASLTDQVIIEPPTPAAAPAASINNNGYVPVLQPPTSPSLPVAGNTQIWTTEHTYSPPSSTTMVSPPPPSPLLSSSSSSSGYQTLSLENYLKMSQLNPEELIIPTWATATAIAMQNHPQSQQQHQQQQEQVQHDNYDNQLQQSQSQQQQVKIAIFDMRQHSSL